VADAARTGPYVPRLLRGTAPWPLQRTVRGVLASVDVSGFTALSERLAAHGREGAEELTRLLTQVFSGMVVDAEAAGGDVLAFGGDAVLVLFPADDATLPANRALAAVQRMVAQVAEPLASPLVGDVHLRTSSGLHGGTFHLAVPAVGHRQLVVYGPDVSACLRAEAAADAGEIRVTAELASLLPPDSLGPPADDGTRTVREPVSPPVGQPADVAGHLDPLVSIDIDGPAGPAADADPSVYLPPGLVAEVATGATLGEHRRVCIGFLAIGGLDELTMTLGPDAVATELAAVGQGLAAAVARTGVHVLASDAAANGVKLIVAAGAPTSVGDDEAALLGTLRAALATRTRLRLKAGANRGPVFVGDLGGATRRTLTVMGDAVNLAARLMQAARPGQLLASDALLARSSVSFETQALAPLTVKGKRDPVRASFVGSRAGARAAPADVGALVGRDTELAALDAMLAALRDGRGDAVALIGEPGSGRSRVLRAVVERAADLRVAFEVATRDERGAARGSVTRLLRRVCGIPAGAAPEVAGTVLSGRLAEVAPDLLPLAPLLDVPFDLALPPTVDSAAIAPQFRAERGLDQVVAVLGALLDEPTMLVLDGLHHADDASRRLLRAVAAGARNGGWGVLVSHPPDDVLRLEGARAVHLPPLDEEHTRQLVLAATASAPLHDHDVDRVVARAGGNPMFALELARAVAAGDDELSDSVEVLATARIDRLPPASRALVRDLAVLGAEHTRSFVVEVLGDDALDDAVLQPIDELVQVDASSVSFRHALHQQVAYDATSFDRRRQLHARVATVLIDRVPADDPRLSFHLARAGDHAGAWRTAVAAADAARERGAAADAFELYQRALRAAAQLPDVPSDLAEVAEAAGDVAEQASRYDAARAAFDLAAEHLVTPVALARLTRKRGELEERHGRYDDALAAYEHARRLLEGASDADALAERAEIGIATAGVRHRQGDDAASVLDAEVAVAAASQVDHLRAVAHGQYLLGLSLRSLGRDGTEPMRAALRAYERLDDPLGRANAHNNLGIQAYFQGRWDTAAEHYELALVDRRRAGDVSGVGMQVNNLAEIDADRGSWDAATARFEQARRRWVAVRFAAGIALATGNLGRTAARRAAAAGDAGGLAAAEAQLGDALEQFVAIGAAGFADETRCRLAEARLLQYRPAEAADALASVEAIDRSGPPTAELANLLRLQALALAQRGDLRAARTIGSDALAVAEAAGARYELALAGVGQAHILTALEEASDAAAVRVQAVATLRELGVTSAIVPVLDASVPPVVMP
jgi:class 3 adenylate cyclase/tetratricopeptide (TPR) repeat protein